MKSLEQLFEEIRESEELRKDLENSIGDKSTIQEFIRRSGCDATVDDAKAFLAEQYEKMNLSGELTPEELDQAAGGTDMLTFMVIWSTLVATGVLAIGVIQETGADSGC